MHNPHFFTPFLAWKVLFQHLERLMPMDDCHEFKSANDVPIEKWRLYELPNYVSIIARIAVPTPTLTSNVIRHQLLIATRPMKVGMPMVVDP